MNVISEHNATLADTYNSLPYPSYVFSHCQPVRLQALARIKGLIPPSLENANILEIGCSFGGNLIPFALRYPNSRIVGIDLSERQIAAGKALLKEVGIHNIELINADISQVNFNTKFDYIICHGVFSWVPEFVQEAILNVIKNYLNPNGIAFISYNTYPGWKIKEIAKELMSFGSDVMSDRVSRVNQGFDMLNFTNKILKRKNVSLFNSISDLFNNIVSLPTHYISHEFFEEYNMPLYFRDFIRKIEKYDLAYLTDSNRPMIFNHFQFEDDEWQRLCEACDHRVELIEQFVDFIENKEFRCSIITHKDNLKENNITNKIQQYNTCFNVKDIYLYTSFNLVQATEEKNAYWQLNKNLIEFKSSPLSDLIFNYISNSKGPCKVGELLAHIEKSEHYDQVEANTIIWHIIGSYSVYLSLEPINFDVDLHKPFIPEVHRKLIQFIYHNKNITTLSDSYFQMIELDLFTSYLSQYLNGENTIDDLITLVRQSILTGVLEWRKDDVLLASEQILDNEIKEYIEISLDTLKKYGYFQ